MQFLWAAFLLSSLFHAPSAAASALNQYKYRRGGANDVCAEVSADLKLFGLALGRIEACLCISGIPTFLKTNLIGELGVLLGGGPAKVTQAVTDLINEARGKKTCTFPDHSEPAGTCSSSRLCQFVCDPGYEPSPPPPAVPTACIPSHGPSGIPKYPFSKRGASARCSPGTSPCGVPNYPDAWECVDTASALDSCGGCAFPLPQTYTHLDPDATPGIDCSMIPHVSDVQCRASRCVVSRCIRGFAPDTKNSTCILVNTNSSSFSPVDSGPSSQEKLII